MSFDPNYQPFSQQQAGFQFGGSVDPLAYLARIKAMQQTQNPQNQASAATGTAGTDIAKIMELLKQKQMLAALQSGNYAGPDSGDVGIYG